MRQQKKKDGEREDVAERNFTSHFKAYYNMSRVVDKFKSGSILTMMTLPNLNPSGKKLLDYFNYRKFFRCS